MQKQIYIPKSKEGLFERAAKYGESISAVVVAAVERFVLEREAAEKNMDEVVVFHGHTGFFVAKRFVGRLLIESREQWGELRGINYRIYLTRKGSLLISYETVTSIPDERQDKDIQIVDPMPADRKIVLAWPNHDKAPAKSLAAWPVPVSLIKQALETIGESPAELLDV